MIDQDSPPVAGVGLEGVRQVDWRSNDREISDAGASDTPKGDFVGDDSNPDIQETQVLVVSLKPLVAKAFKSTEDSKPASITGDPKQLVLPSDQRNADNWFNTAIFNKVSSAQLANNVRTFPLRFSNVRLDSQRRWDVSLNKTFTTNERFKLKFRGDCFNLLNEPVLRGPDTGVISSTFGRITAQEPPRSFQFGLNMQF